MEKEEITSQTCSPDGSFSKTEIAEIDSKKLWRKVDMKLLPILTVMYLFSFMDRGMFCDLESLSCVTDLFCVANIGRHLYLFFLITDATCHLSGNARLQGLETELKMRGSQFNLALVSVSSPRPFSASLTHSAFQDGFLYCKLVLFPIHRLSYEKA
jgi:hypothetical protein